MIEKVRIRGYRKFGDLVFEPNPRFNVIVGDNGSGKSTLLEAIGLALTGRINGRLASDELNPYWFNQDEVAAFFDARAHGKKVAPPVIDIEVFLADRDEFAKNLLGAHNSDQPTRECPGVRMRIEPNPEYATEIEAHLSSETGIIPVEYYKVDWRSFGDQVLTRRPKELTAAIIDSRTIRSSNGVDYHLRQILNDHLRPEAKAHVSLAFRKVKEEMTNVHLAAVNDEMKRLDGALDDKPISLAMDQSSRGSWDASVVPHVADLPFAMAGQGQQAAIKIALAMSRNADSVHVAMVEEPENHLSHTSLNVLLKRIEALAGDEQQLLITTHSSYVLNRLGLDGLRLIAGDTVGQFGALNGDTVNYFKKLPGYDTLRMVLADKSVLVEGPSDEILFERFYRDETGHRPIEDGIDVFSMRGLSLARCLKVAQMVDKHCAVLRDNDGKQPADLVAELGSLVDGIRRKVFIGEPALGKTLEPQVLSANPDDAKMRRVLRVTDRAGLQTWMTNAKTEAALRIAESAETLAPPPYFKAAIEFIRG
ncbi:ATP-dependent nuclease [Acidipropionibacterium acidipropionici]|uniref:ATP-dependent nuclease n=1 Tax=Acidipropionibacterium acidipropionici TaxID=1748 RepID=UPI00110A71F9|nr:AAA family ATPase [Acidipropionibacterium acidipropionici]QCV95310.1 ATP-dependent endonuclease [Acidipropionibacterium acidipropionici]